MYLKKVDIQGFKSFAEKTDVEFKSRVTAIVGPNGSGKSNIADAIRWVLGEQSVKSLRGNKMEDIIFSGTEKRKALGFAEVTITFDNASGKIPTDYREVAVTRRMFRSGESEYYINKNSCRLKDIRELFMDTGVGKEGYSIIGQGKIDEILSNKPEDRRNIFEEAAGIVKYKSRKQDALRKLDKTENNLTRISDLIHEIKSQRDTLEIEAEKATKFQHLYGQLRDLDVSISVQEINKQRSQLDQLEEKRVKITEEKEIVDGEEKSLDEFYTTTKEELNLLESQIEEKRTLKMESIQTFERNKNRVQVISEKELYLNKERDRLAEEIKNHKETLVDDDIFFVETNQQIEKLNTTKTTLDREFKILSEEKENLNKEIQYFENEINSKKEELMESHSILSDKKSQSNTIISFNESISKRLDNLNLEKEKLLLDQNSIKAKEDDLLSALDLRTMDIYAARNKLSTLEEEYLSVESRISDIDTQLRKLNISIEKNTSTIGLYRSMENEYEGYFNSVKSILKAVEKDLELGEGYIGLVAELFTVDKKFLKAIDIALGGSAQNIVVEHDKVAKRLIDFLKKNNKGRATFLPLNTVTSYTLALNDKDKRDFNLFGFGNELIKFDDKYINIFNNLLGRTIIAYDMDNALKYSKKYGFKSRIVTLDGEIINPGGSLTGGSVSNQNISILNRKHNLRELEEIISIQKSEKEDLLVELSELVKESDEMKYEIDNSKGYIDEIDKIILDINYEIKNFRSEQQRLLVEITKKDSELSSLIDERSSLEGQSLTIEKEYENLLGETSFLRAEISTMQTELDEMKEKRSFLEESITELRVKINHIENRITEAELKISSYEEDKRSSSLDLLSKTEQLSSIEVELDEILEEKTSLKVYIEKQETIEENDANELRTLNKNRERLRDEFYNLQDRLKTITQRNSKLERELNKIEVDFEKSNLVIENNLEKLSEEYQIQLEDALKFEGFVTNIREAKTEINSLKAQIRELGNVNIGAIEEFKAIDERFEFLTGQINDLNVAKEDIQKVVKDMEKKMRVQFRKSFDMINEKFSETFAILFSGGKARLEIDEDEDILTAGIEIMAQPPGKKLQSLTLLSGGEKSLTAVALLFAILKTKPSPFCILDEIDAALDEANISRYTNYLKTFDNSTQFVLITHRKTTMEIADILYGVTMEEEGVSRLISLKLKDFTEVAS